MNLASIAALVLGGTFIALIGDVAVLGFKLTGWGWVVPLCGSALALVARSRKIAFPVWIWVPWTLLTVTYCIISREPSLQRTAQLLTPLVVGVAASTCRPTARQVDGLFRAGKWLAIALWLVVAVKTEVLWTGVLPDAAFLAPEVMTGALLATMFAARALSGHRRDFAWWGLMVALPLFAVTRTAIVAAALTLPFSFAPMKLRVRALVLAGAGAIAVATFYTPRVQAKMFYSGAGTFSDLLGDDVKSSGRFDLWASFSARIADAPLLGHGAGSAERFASRMTGGEIKYPHNDWLLTTYDYGLFGTLLYVVTLAAASLHAFVRAKRSEGDVRILLYIAASSVVPYAVTMITDNIMVYSSFFGNLQMLWLGAAYGAMRTPRARGLPNASHDIYGRHVRANPFMQCLAHAVTTSRSRCTQECNYVLKANGSADIRSL